MPSTARLLLTLAGILANQLLGCGATFNVFISSSQLESYFQGTADFSLVQGLQIEIIRNGQSLVLDDGSLQLVEDNSAGSGSGETPTGETPTTESPERQRRAFSFLTPMDSSMLPPLPSDVDAVVFSWFATANVSYQLLLGATPTGHFEEVTSNVSATGSIPRERSDFSILFPCDSSSTGIGLLQVCLSTVDQEGAMLNVSFFLEKSCRQAVTATSTPPLLPTSPLLPASLMLPTSLVLPTPPFVTAPTSIPVASTSADFPSPSSAVPTADVLPTPTPTEILLVPISSLLVEASAVTNPPPSSPPPSQPQTPLPSPLPSPLPTASAEDTIQTTTLSVLPSVAPTLPGTRTTPTSETSSFVELLIIVFAPVVGALILSIVILCCSVCICCMCCRRKSRKHFNDDPADLPVNIGLQDNYLETFELEVKKNEVPISLWMSLAWGSISNLPAGIQGVIKRYSTDRRSLNILSTVSRGDYGCIVNGQLCVNRNDPIGGNKGVMMKMSIGFQKQYGHRDEITKFLETATLLRGLDHPNVHSLLKVSVEDNYVPIVIYPIVEYGDLHQFLVLCRITPGDSPLSPVTIQNKVSFAYQIVNGMKHLCDNGIVHPDLALRNCYLDTNYQVKVSDGALSHCFHQECYHAVRGTVRPVRWAALETLQEGLCTSHSNVWSYGVTVWELMTLARLPYLEEVDQNRGVLTHLLMQNRLTQPEDCPDNIYSIMSDCWRERPEARPNFDTLHSLMHNISNQYAAIQATAPPTTHGLGEINYSTFGKNLRAHDAPPLETASVSLSHAGSLHRRVKSGGGSLRGSMSRGSPATSQRNSQNMLGVDNMSDGRLSLTFSVLSNENELDDSGSESEAEGPAGGLNFEIPSFLTAELNPSSLYPSPGRPPPAESPMDMVSTFLGSTKPPPHMSHDHTDSAPLSTFTPPSQLSPTTLSPTTPVPPPATPPAVTMRRPSSDNASCISSQNGPRSSGNVPTPPSFSGSTTPDMVPPAVSITPSNQDTISKPSTPDSFTTYSSGHHSTPSSHIPGIPGSTYNNTSVSIDDIKLRNKSQLTTSSSHAGGASKSDSGIRSDEEVESVLSNGGQSSESSRTPVSMTTVGRHQEVEKKDSETSLGLSNLSGDLMATFASWGKN